MCKLCRQKPYTQTTHVDSKLSRFLIAVIASNKNIILEFDFMDINKSQRYRMRQQHYCSKKIIFRTAV